MDDRAAKRGVVAIGRNEGDRLKACLASLCGEPHVVYVDSGSSDGSQAWATAQGVEVLNLAVPPAFSAARARNTGLAALLEKVPDLVFVQLVDGDCVVEPGWLDTAQAALTSDPALAAVMGRRRERFPHVSIYNRLCDDEWNVPLGSVETVGGDAMFRVAPMVAAGGYREDLIAGEEPDLCLRMSQTGWRFRRIDAAMTLHDAAITRIGQWWARHRRAGWAYAEHIRRHGSQAFPDWQAQLRRIRLWGLAMPAAAAAALAGSAVWWPAGLVTLGIAALFALQILRFGLRDRDRWADTATNWKAAALLVLAKLPQAQGIAQNSLDRHRGKAAALIEYKSG